MARRVVHFEIHADDPAACAAWYGNLFGWSIQELPGIDYWTVSTGEGPGIDGAIMLRRGTRPASGAPVNGFVCTVGTDDIDRDLARALAAGGIEALAKFAVPGVGWGAYVIDPFGNIFGLHQHDTGAK